MKVPLDKLVEGYELPSIIRVMTIDKMHDWHRWPEVKGIHTDDEIARQAGLPRAITQGNMFLSYVPQMLCNVFGEHLLKGSKLTATFLVPVFDGDTLTTKGKIVQKTRENSDISFNIEVWIENQRGEKVSVGTVTLKVRQ